MNFNKTVLFEDDYQGEVEQTMSPSSSPQQIVINNPGTVVIQSPTNNNVPQVQTFDDDNQDFNYVDSNVKPEQPINSVEFDDDNQNMQLDPDYQMFNNPSPDLDNVNNTIKYDQNTLPDQEIPNSINDPSLQNNMFDDDLPNKDVSQTQVGNVQEPMSDMPVNSQFFDDDVQNQQIPQQQEIPQQAVPESDPNMVQPPVFDDDSQVPQQQVVGTPQMMQMDPNTNQMMDPNMMAQPVAQPVEQGIPAQPNAMVQDPMNPQPPEAAIDPNTGMPIVDPNMAAAGGTAGIDPTTGLPIDPMAMGISPQDGYTDEANPEMTIGNASEVKTGSPVALEDLSRINELKKINSQLNRVKALLDKELSNKYNKVEEKLNEAIEFFRNIIMNLDSFSLQIDDIIFKYKRFVLTLLTQINTLKKQEKEEKSKSKKSR